MKRTVVRVLSFIGLVGCVGQTPEPEEERPPVEFGFPLAEPERFPLLVGVDHDPIAHEDSVAGAVICTDYMGRGFPNCYDEHDGNDYLLTGGFDEMDADPAAVLAAADGVVVQTEDGNYDKCHPGGGTSIDCDGYPIKANFVIVEHADGITSRYWHLRKHSVRVEVGDEVTCGDILGEVGSSGVSSKPHLHFEVNRPDGRTLNPYAGPHSQDLSWWAQQNAPDILPGAGCTAP